MGKFNKQLHDLMKQGGYRYDAQRDRYFLRREAVWDVEKRIEKGRRQLSVPARTKSEFTREEQLMVEGLMGRLRSRALAEGKLAPQEAEEEGYAQETAAKRAKKAQRCKEGRPPVNNEKVCGREAHPEGEEQAGHVGDTPPFDVVGAELTMLRPQAAKLRQTIARRRTIPGSCCASDDVPAIVAHYESVLSELEQRIAVSSRGPAAAA